MSTTPHTHFVPHLTHPERLIVFHKADALRVERDTVVAELGLLLFSETKPSSILWLGRRGRAKKLRTHFPNRNSLLWYAESVPRNCVLSQTACKIIPTYIVKNMNGKWKSRKFNVKKKKKEKKSYLIVVEVTAFQLCLWPDRQYNWMYRTLIISVQFAWLQVAKFNSNMLMLAGHHGGEQGQEVAAKQAKKREMLFD